MEDVYSFNWKEYEEETLHGNENLHSRKKKQLFFLFTTRNVSEKGFETWDKRRLALMEEPNFNSSGRLTSSKK